MRRVLMMLAVVALATAPSLAAVDVAVVADNASIAVGGTATVAVMVKSSPGTGVASLAGSVVATGTGLSASTFAFAAPWDRPTGIDPGTGLAYPCPKVVGTAGTNGGWNAFGSMQTPHMVGGVLTDLPTQTTATYGNDVWVTFATYTVTADAVGAVTLAFVPSPVGGFLPVSTDKDETVGTCTGVTIGVTPEPVTLSLLALGGLLVARRRRA